MDRRAEAMIQSWMNAQRKTEQVKSDRDAVGSEQEGEREGKWYCFAEGTAVRTASGMQPIESLMAGAAVLTFDWSLGGVREAQVEELERHEVEFPIFDVRAGESVVTVTAGHRFARGDSWVPVESLDRGSRCVDIHGRSSSISLISAPRLERRTVFNVRVEGGDNYFVGQPGLMVRQH